MRNWKKRLILGVVLLTTASAIAEETPVEVPGGKREVNLIESYPHLKQYLFKETDTEIRFGFGLSPLQVMKQKAAIGLSIFQVHVMTRNWDWEVFNATFGSTVSGDALSKMYSFHFRSFPKWRISESFSIGLLMGYELVSFPDVKARLRNPTTNKATFEEPMSARGLIYGAGASQLMKVGKSDQLVRISEVLYKQNYDIKSSLYGWDYVFTDNALNTDATAIEPGYVFLLEVSFLY